MSYKKIAIALSISGLVCTGLVGLFTINKAVNKLATSKRLLDKKNKEIYHWRFGDISYSVLGDGKPVLLIHGLKEDSSSVEWSKIIPELSRTNTVYAVDLLGCGLSEKPTITYTNYMYIQLVNDFIKNIIKRKTAVIATGKSASIVLGACAVNEDIFEELILINPDEIRSLNKSPSKRTNTANLILRIPIIGTFIYHIKSRKKRIRENFHNRYFYDTENVGEALVDYYYESSHLGGCHAKNLYASLIGRYTNANVIPMLKSINRNIHILAGREIPNIEARIKEYLYYNPAIEAEFIDYTMELPQLEAPDEILKYIQLYLSEIVS